MKRILLTLFVAVSTMATAQTKEITILAVNDMHAAIEQFPKFAAMVDSVRAIHPDLLLLSAGDNRTGNPLNDMYSPTSYPMMALMNQVRFNLSAIGNHEFDSKPSGLRYLVNNSNFRYVCANMYPNDTLRLHVEPYKIFECDGVRVGVLGLVQIGETKIPDTHPNNVVGIKFRLPYEVANEYAWLRDRCDVFIILSHEGFEDEVELAKLYPKADAIIGGHSHTLVQETKLINDVLVTQAGKSLKYATEVTIKVADGKVMEKKAHLISVSDFSHKDEKVQAMVDEFCNNETMERVLTQATADFTCKEELGCLMADGMRYAGNADIAIQNCGGVRYETHPKGNITVKDIYALDPFGNEMIAYNLSGKEVKSMLAAACRADEYGPAYVSGINYSITLGKNYKDVKKVEITMPDGTKIDDNKTYKIVTSSYTASICDFERVDEGQNLFVVCAEELIKYLSKQPVIDYKGIKRITIKKN